VKPKALTHVHYPLTKRERNETTKYGNQWI